MEREQIRQKKIARESQINPSCLSEFMQGRLATSARWDSVERRIRSWLNAPNHKRLGRM